jgi:hypothetical protein
MSSTMPFLVSIMLIAAGLDGDNCNCMAETKQEKKKTKQTNDIISLVH